MEPRQKKSALERGNMIFKGPTPGQDITSIMKQKSNTKCVRSLMGAGSRLKPDCYAGPCQLNQSNLFLYQQATDLNAEEFKQQRVWAPSAVRRKDCILKRSLRLLWKKEEGT